MTVQWDPSKFTDKVEKELRANWSRELQGKKCPHGEPLAEGHCPESKPLIDLALKGTIRKTNV